MSDDTLERLVQAAKAFKNDVTQLPGLRNALAAHDAAEGATPPAEPAPPTTLAEGTTEPSEQTPPAEGQPTP